VGGEIVKKGVDYVADKVYDSSPEALKIIDKSSKVASAISKVGT
jgi:hypothetical protein